MAGTSDSLRSGVLADTPLGSISVTVSPRGLVAVAIGAEGGEHSGAGEEPERAGGEPDRAGGGAEGVGAVLDQLAEYFAGRRRAFDLELDWSVLTEFQQLALGAVSAIPCGEVRTYADIARAIGRPGAVRAVGRANATNPMPIVIPCHRVLGSDGGLHGYGAPGGIQTKAWLLRHEGYALL